MSLELWLRPLTMTKDAGFSLGPATRLTLRRAASPLIQGGRFVAMGARGTAGALLKPFERIRKVDTGGGLGIPSRINAVPNWAARARKSMAESNAAMADRFAAERYAKGLEGPATGMLGTHPRMRDKVESAVPMLKTYGPSGPAAPTFRSAFENQMAGRKWYQQVAPRTFDYALRAPYALGRLASHPTPLALGMGNALVNNVESGIKAVADQRILDRITAARDTKDQMVEGIANQGFGDQLQAMFGKLTLSPEEYRARVQQAVDAQFNPGVIKELYAKADEPLQAKGWLQGFGANWANKLKRRQIAQALIALGESREAVQRRFPEIRLS